MKIRDLFFITVLLLSACNSRDNRFLESSLALADANRAELEKVLTHYRSDTLKLGAAKFLIENMWAHFSFVDNSLNRYYDKLDSLSTCYAGKYDNATRAVFAEYFERERFSYLAGIPDVKVVGAEYLIETIDGAFSLREKFPWLQDLSFSDFCEYVLPYKVCEYQTLDDWRNWFQDLKYGDIRFLPFTGGNSLWACEKINTVLHQNFPSIPMDIDAPAVKRMRTLVTSMKTRDCEDDSYACAAVMRAKGVPIAVDFTPQWAGSQVGHVWCVLIDNTRKNTAFNGFSESKFAPFSRNFSKAYRYTFSVNEELFLLNKSGEKIPPLFQNICFKDVTDEYTAVAEVEVPVEKTKNRHAYLCTFNNREWNPVAFGKIKNGKAQFSKVGKNVQYLVGEMIERGIKPISDVFLLNNDGKIEKISPKTAKTQTLRLTRKYPAMWWLDIYGHRPIGGRFQAANKADFSDSTTVAVITKFGTESDEFIVNSKEKYRYWRFLSAPDGWGHISEVYYLKEGKNIAKQGKVWGMRDERFKDRRPENLYDNDPLTPYEAPTPSGSWSGLDFGEPVSIDKILYAPRADGNGVTFGDEYELSYWEKDGWRSLGRKTANSVYIEFDNCPENALFLLHDLTRGVEDRPFTYRNGKQIFW
jgi:hypothetical protein